MINFMKLSIKKANKVHSDFVSMNTKEDNLQNVCFW